MATQPNTPPQSESKTRTFFLHILEHVVSYSCFYALLYLLGALYNSITVIQQT